MLSTFPPILSPDTLAPPPGGTLLCLWLASDAETLLVCRTLSQLVILPNCGAQSWPNTSKVLFVIWAEADQVQILRGLLSAFGSATDWPTRLKLTGDWTVFGGEPTYAEREYELGQAA